ncbi:MAG: hypothetical protein ACP5L0_07775, partial [Caldisphaera sp.]|uniref:hypothetical protein n=1 Tax=Caldisphaera sp. TaxID=2060322 RepID=UPI003D10C81D
SLIIVGTVVGTQKLLEQIRRKTLIRLLSHDIGEFSNQLEQCLSSSGMQKSKVEELMKSYILDGIDPNKYSLTEYFYHVQEIEEEEKPAFVVNIGLDTLLNLLADNEVYPRLELDAIIRRMNEGITTLYLMNGIIRDYYKIPLNEVYNNIWYFHISKDNKLIIRPFRLRMKIFTNEIYQVDSKTLKCF